MDPFTVGIPAQSSRRRSARARPAQHLEYAYRDHEDGPVVTPQRRRGAQHPDLVPRDVLRALESGLPSANHMEQIALDMGNLLALQIPALAGRASELRAGGLVTKMRRGGEILFDAFGLDFLPDASAWTSDTLRGW